MAPSPRRWETFIGRSSELGDLRRALDRPASSVVAVSGPAGIGKSALVRRAAEGYDSIVTVAPPLPEPDQIDHLGRDVATWAARSGESEPDRPRTWEKVFRAIITRPGDRRVLVVDDAHRLRQSRARLEQPLRQALERVDRAGGALHVVIVGPAPLLPESGRAPALHLRLGPLGLTAATHFLPRGSPTEIVQAYTVFGGYPTRLRMLDPSATWTTNLRRLLLERGAPLADAGLAMLERSFQTPSRYAAVLARLSLGEADWSTVHQSVSDLSASGQLAPYIKRLSEMGVIETRRSLDHPPTSRARRYRIRDAFHAFWFRFLFPSGPDADHPNQARRLFEVVRDGVSVHSHEIFRGVCRDFMRSDAIASLGANARETGSLWGTSFDIPVAGVLRSGQPFYGRTGWVERLDTSALDHLDREIRNTRYGFGREVRLRILFGGAGFTPSLRRAAARRDNTLLIDAAEMVSSD